MAPKKKPAGGKKSAKAAAKPKKKKSSGEAVSLTPFILLASVVTLLIGGGLLYMFSGYEPAQITESTPPAAAPVAKVEQPAAAPAAAPAEGGGGRRGNAVAEAPPRTMPPLPANPAPLGVAPRGKVELGWLPLDTNLLIQVNWGSINSSPLGRMLISQMNSGSQSAGAGDLLGTLSKLGIASPRQFSLGFAGKDANLAAMKAMSESEQAALPTGWALLIENEDAFNISADQDAESDGPFQSSGGSGVFSLKPASAEILPPEARDVRFQFPDQNLALISDAATMGQLSMYALPSGPETFPRVPQADVIVAWKIDLMESMVKLNEGGELPAAASVAQLPDMKAAGVQSAFVAIDFKNGLDVAWGVHGSNASENTRMLGELLKTVDEVKSQLAEFQAAPLSDELKQAITGLVESVTVNRTEGTISAAAHLSPETIAWVQGPGMGEIMGLVLFGPGGPPEGAAGLDPAALGFSGGLSGGSMAMFDQPPQPAAEVSGLDPEQKLAAVTSWDDPLGGMISAAAAPPLQANLVIAGGMSGSVVQYRGLKLTSAAAADGSPLKPRAPLESAFVNGDTWRPATAAMLPEAGLGAMIPLTFDPVPAAAAGISALAGELELRSSAATEELVVGASGPGKFDFAMLRDAGLVVVPGVGRDAGTILIYPGSADLALVEVRADGGGGLLPPSAAPPGGAVAGGPAAPAQAPSVAAQNEEYLRMIEGQNEAPPEEGSADFAASARGGPAPNAAPAAPVVTQIAMNVPPLAPAQSIPLGALAADGYQVSIAEAGSLTVRIAKNVRTQTVSFRFEGLKVPAPESPLPEPEWIASTETARLPDGIQSVFVRAAGWAPAEAGKRTRVLNLTLDLVGPAADLITAVGSERGEGTGGENKIVKVDLQADGSGDRPSGFDSPPLPNRPRGLPLNTYRVVVPVAAFEPDYTSIAKFTGEIRVRIAKSRSVAVVAGVETKRLVHEALKANSLTPALALADGSVTVTVPKARRDAIEWIQLLDAQDRPLLHILPSLARDDKTGDVYTLGLPAGTPPPAQLKVRIVVNNETGIVVIPFAFENVPVPAP